MWLCRWELLILSHYPVKFGVCRPSESGDIMFLISHVTTWQRGWCVMWFCRWDPIILNHHPAKFGVHRPCKGGDITFFICHLTQYRSVTWLCGWSTLILVTTLLSVGSIGLMELEIMAFVISVPILVPIPIPIPMLRFQCRDLQMARFCLQLIKLHRYIKINFKP